MGVQSLKDAHPLTQNRNLSYKMHTALSGMGAFYHLIVTLPPKCQGPTKNIFCRAFGCLSLQVCVQPFSFNAKIPQGKMSCGIQFFLLSQISVFLLPEWHERWYRFCSSLIRRLTVRIVLPMPASRSQSVRSNLRS